MFVVISRTSFLGKIAKRLRLEFSGATPESVAGDRCASDIVKAKCKVDAFDSDNAHVRNTRLFRLSSARKFDLSYDCDLIGEHSMLINVSLSTKSAYS